MELQQADNAPIAAQMVVLNVNSNHLCFRKLFCSSLQGFACLHKQAVCCCNPLRLSNVPTITICLSQDLPALKRGYSTRSCFVFAIAVLRCKRVGSAPLNSTSRQVHVKMCDSSFLRAAMNQVFQEMDMSV